MHRGYWAMLALAVLLFSFLLVLAGVSTWHGHRDARATAESRASSAAYVAAAHAGWVVEANRQALRRIAEWIGARDDFLDGPRSTDLAELGATLPGAVTIWVFDAQGWAVMSSGEPFAEVEVAGQPYFQALQSGAEWTLGGFFFDPVTGRKTFPIGQRILRDGKFSGAVVSFVPADLMADVWASMELGEGSTVSLVGVDGRLVARFPLPDEPIDLSGHVLFTEHLPRARNGVYESRVSPADGVGRIVAYRELARQPLVAIAAVPVSALEGAFWQRARELALVTTPFALALLAVSTWALVLVRREERSRFALDEALARNELLFREIHHRVKNNLQTAAALVRLQPGLTEAKSELTQRIAAMAAVHEHIHAAGRFDMIDLAAYVRRLVQGLQESHGDIALVECRLAPALVSAQYAMPLAMIINEAIDNAFKHAFPDGRRGRILVGLEVPEPGRARLTVADDGVGRAGEARAGLGIRLIEGLAQQIGGSHTFRDQNGTHFELDFPLQAPPSEPDEP